MILYSSLTPWPLAQNSLTPWPPLHFLQKMERGERARASGGEDDAAEMRQLTIILWKNKSAYLQSLKC